MSGQEETIKDVNDFKITIAGESLYLKKHLQLLWEGLARPKEFYEVAYSAISAKQIYTGYGLAMCTYFLFWMILIAGIGGLPAGIIGAVLFQVAIAGFIFAIGKLFSNCEKTFEETLQWTAFASTQVFLLYCAAAILFLITPLLGALVAFPAGIAVLLIGLRYYFKYPTRVIAGMMLIPFGFAGLGLMFIVMIGVFSSALSVAG